MYCTVCNICSAVNNICIGLDAGQSMQPPQQPSHDFGKQNKRFRVSSSTTRINYRHQESSSTTSIKYHHKQNHQQHPQHHHQENLCYQILSSTRSLVIKNKYQVSQSRLGVSPSTRSTTTSGPSLLSSSSFQQC